MAIHLFFLVRSKKNPQHETLRRWIFQPLPVVHLIHKITLYAHKNSANESYAIDAGGSRFVFKITFQLHSGHNFPPRSLEGEGIF